MAYRTIEIKLADGRIITKRIDERGIVPAGGTNEQVLGKLSDTDFHVDWIDATDPRVTDTKNPHGLLHYDDTDTVLSFDESTRTVTITPVPTSPLPSPLVFKYYIDSVAYYTGEQSATFADTEGTWFFYLDHDGLLYATQSFDDAGEHCFVAALYWDATNNQIIYQANERHTVAFDHDDWKYKHFTFGTQWRSGSGVTNITVNGTGDDNAHAIFTVESGVIDDEDIRHLLAQSTTYDIFYKLGVNGDWRRSDIQSAYGVHKSTTRATFNEFTGGAWQLTEVSNLNFVLAHVFATNNLLSPYIVVMGQSEHGTLTAAREGANVEMNNLITVGLPFQEFVPVASIIYQTSTGYTNAVASRIRSTDTGDDYVNWLGQQLSPTVTPSAHNNLTGLQLAGDGVIWGHIDSETLDDLARLSDIPTTLFADGGEGITIEQVGSPAVSVIKLGGTIHEDVFLSMDDDSSITIGDPNANGPSMQLLNSLFASPTYAAAQLMNAEGGNFGLVQIVNNGAHLSVGIQVTNDGDTALVKIEETGMEYHQDYASRNIGNERWIPDVAAVEAMITSGAQLTADELAAINGAASPSASNVFITNSALPAVIGYFGRAQGVGGGEIALPTSTGQKIFFIEGIVVGSPVEIIDTFNLSVVTGSQIIIRFINETGLQLASGTGNLGFDITIPSAYYEIKCEYDGLIWQLVDTNELTDDQMAAINNANSPSLSNPFATMDDIPSVPSVTTYAAGTGITITPGSPDDIISTDLLTVDQLAAVAGASLPSASNVFATIADLHDTVSMTNGVDNRVVTATGADSLNGEANLTYDGTRLIVNKTSEDTIPALGSVGGSLNVTRDGVYGLMAGHLSSGNFWLQVQRNDANSEVYDLILQPNGGNVGIGTNSPSKKLTINAPNGVVDGIRVTYNSVTTEGLDLLYLNSGNSICYIDSRYDNAGAEMKFRLRTNGTPVEVLRLTGAGDAYFIGNVVTDSLFAGDGTESIPAHSFINDTNTGFWRVSADTIGVSLGGDEKYRFTGGDFHTAGDTITSSTSTPSDRRLKAEIRPLQNSLDKVLRLAGVSFHLRKDKTKRRKYGLIAQDVQPVCQEVVKEVEMMDGKKRLTVDYQAIIPVLIEAIKEQQKQIDELKKMLK